MITTTWVYVIGSGETPPHGFVAAAAGVAEAVKKIAAAIAHPATPPTRPNHALRTVPPRSLGGDRTSHRGT
jgi:hypothetical protein